MRQLQKLLITALVPLSYSNATATIPVVKPWLRVQGEAEQLKVSTKQARFMAFTDKLGRKLQVLDMRTNQVMPVTKHLVGRAFFWAPDGLRLFYRALVKAKSGEIHSEVKAFDCLSRRQVTVATYPYITGILTYDPRDLRMHLLSKKGIHTQRIYFPDQRLAQWQVAQRTEFGKWLVSDQGVIWSTDGGFSLSKLEDDGSGLQAFSIAPDGSAIAWSTKAGRIYFSVDGLRPRFVGFGADPTWHPRKPLILFSGARRIGDKAVDYDLKLANQRGYTKYLTYTQGIPERWPTWTPDGKTIIYTKSGTTDLFKLEFDANE